MPSVCYAVVTYCMWCVGLLVPLTSKYATSMSLTLYITMELSQLLCLMTMITLRQPKQLSTFTQPCRFCKCKRRFLLKLQGAVRSHRLKTGLHRFTRSVNISSLDHQFSNLNHYHQLPQPPSSIHIGPIEHYNNGVYQFVYNRLATAVPVSRFECVSGLSVK